MLITYRWTFQRMAVLKGAQIDRIGFAVWLASESNTLYSMWRFCEVIDDSVFVRIINIFVGLRPVGDALCGRIR